MEKKFKWGKSLKNKCSFLAVGKTDYVGVSINFQFIACISNASTDIFVHAAISCGVDS